MPTKKLSSLALTLVLSLVVAASLAAAGGVPPVAAGLASGFASGTYESLLVGFDPASGKITGSFDEGTGADPRSGAPLYRCAFYLAGEADGAPPWKIAAWFPGEERPVVIPGTLEPAAADENGHRSVRIKLAEEPGGCANVRHFAEKDGAVFGLDSGRGSGTPWTGVRMVAAKRARLHRAPAAAARQKGYFLRGDVLRVLAARPGWVRTERGWVKAGDLFPAEPPR